MDGDWFDISEVGCKEISISAFDPIETSNASGIGRPWVEADNLQDGQVCHSSGVTESEKI
jgi:hypothetical protein